MLGMSTPYWQLGPPLSSIERGPLHKKSKTVLNWVYGSVIPLARITLLRLVSLNPSTFTFYLISLFVL